MPQLIRMLAVALLLYAAAATSFAQQTPSDLFQRARVLEETNQNLEAIKLYNQVASLAKNERRLAANALYRVGLLYDRLGRKAQALQAFKVVVNQYPDQMDIAERARGKLAAAGANAKKDAEFVVKRAGPSPDGRFLATFTFPAQLTDYDLVFAIDSEHKRLYVVTKRLRPLGKDAASKRALEKGLQEVYEPSTVVVIDTHSNAVIKTIPLPVYIGSLAFNPTTNKLYGNATADGHVRVFDVNTLAQTTIPLEGYPGDIAIDATRNKVYVASQGFSGNDKLFVIDGATNAVSARLDLDGVTGQALVFNSATNRVYACAGEPEKSRVFNGADNSLMADLPRLHVFAADPVHNRLYAALVNEQGGPVGFRVLDGETHEVIGQVGLIPEAVGLNPNTGRVYVSHYDRKALSIVDANTSIELSRVSFPDVLPSIGVDPTTGRLYAVAYRATPVLGVIDKDSLEEDAPEEFFEGFDGPGLDPAWTVVKGLGSYSLAEKPGQLRLRVGGSQARAPLLLLFRRFRGEYWTLETKASYFMGTSGSTRSLDLVVAFGMRSQRAGSGAVTPDSVFIRRSRGDWNGCCPGTTHVRFYEGASASVENVPPNATDAYVWRMKRTGRRITVERSDDGINFTVIGAHTFGPQIDGLIQYVGLTYGNWQNTDAYADYDYIRLSKAARD